MMTFTLHRLKLTCITFTHPVCTAHWTNSFSVTKTSRSKHSRFVT